MTRKLTIRVALDIDLDCFNVYIFEKADDKRLALTPEGWKEKEEQQALSPAFSVSTESAESLQSLVSQLWDLGFRPKGAQGSEGELGATRAHLKDMQSLTKDLLAHTLTKGTP